MRDPFVPSYSTGSAHAMANAYAQQAQNTTSEFNPPEERIATMVREDLGVSVNPQALRMFIRARWARLSKAAHEIHDA